jgi:hypothetical protein
MLRSSKFLRRGCHAGPARASPRRRYGLHFALLRIPTSPIPAAAAQPSRCPVLNREGEKRADSQGHVVLAAWCRAAARDARRGFSRRHVRSSGRSRRSLRRRFASTSPPRRLHANFEVSRIRMTRRGRQQALRPRIERTSVSRFTTTLDTPDPDCLMRARQLALRARYSARRRATAFPTRRPQRQRLPPIRDVRQGKCGRDPPPAAQLLRCTMTALVKSDISSLVKAGSATNWFHSSQKISRHKKKAHGVPSSFRWEGGWAARPGQEDSFRGTTQPPSGEGRGVNVRPRRCRRAATRRNPGMMAFIEANLGRKQQMKTFECRYLAPMVRAKKVAASRAAALVSRASK